MKDPLQFADNWQVSQNEFALQMEGVGDFYARNGNYVEFSPSEGADPEWVKLYLNGRVLVALLHQRKIMNFHASSFIHNDRGIMITGRDGLREILTDSFIYPEWGRIPFRRSDTGDHKKIQTLSVASFRIH